MVEKKKTIRCAIYTRKSTDEGLEQEFNSLDAQRMAGENYIASQTGEGWVCLPEQYNDGGYTGGNMERPALKRLMADAEAGKLDCIVVYKVDRLSRSLMDFAKILGVLEKKEVSFVSVTQHFNTTNSMGRLTLNILLSFAQFEREVISERTRDKIAMARQQGKWSGGIPVLGYDISPEGKGLVINDAEAEQVRRTFELYLEHHSLLAVVDELDRRGWTNKTWVTKKGALHQGKPYNKNSLHNLLTNPLYIGKIRHHKEVYEGEHEGIIENAVFEKVQRILRQNSRAGNKLLFQPTAKKNGGILNGILRCKSCGCGMSHSYSKKQTKRYRYYVCQNAQNRGWSNCPHPSLPADEIEKFVVEEIRNICQDETLIREIVQQSHSAHKAEITEYTKQYKLAKKELAKRQRELDSLRLAVHQPDTAARIDALQEQVKQMELKAADLLAHITEIKGTVLDAEELAGACRKFNPVWDTLTSKEQWRILKLLLERVEFDAGDSSISLCFHPVGVKLLNEELTEPENVAS